MNTALTPLRSRLSVLLIVTSMVFGILSALAATATPAGAGPAAGQYTVLVPNIPVGS